MGFGLIVALVLATHRWWGRASRAPVDHAPVDLRGEPIAPPPSIGIRSPTATGVVTVVEPGPGVADTTGTNAPTRRKRPKPGSYPQRLVQSLAAGKGTDTVEYAEGTLPPIKIVPIPAMPPTPGYEPITFAQLSAFEFELKPALVKAGEGTTTSADEVVGQIPPAIRQLNGRKVALQGFIVPLRMDDGLAVEFLLVRDQTLCCFGRLPKVNEWVLVRTLGKGAKPVMDEPVTVCGRIEVGDQRENGILVGLYRMEVDRVIQH